MIEPPPIPPSGSTRGSRWRGLISAAPAVIGAVLPIGLWWLAIWVFQVESFLVPSPPQVVKAFAKMPGYMLSQTWRTLAEILVGFAISAIVGMLIGVMMAVSRLVEQMSYPWLIAVNAAPKVAFAPLLVVWLGFGTTPKIVMVILVSVFPIILSTVTGLTSTPVDFADLAKSLSASRWQTFSKVRLPGALPQVFVGLKVSMPLAVVGAVIGELVGSDSGLGFVISQSGATGDTALAFSAILILAFLSVALYYALVLLERALLPWVAHTTSQR